MNSFQSWLQEGCVLSDSATMSLKIELWFLLRLSPRFVTNIMMVTAFAFSGASGTWASYGGTC
jgi:hypothetical protein